MDTETQAASRKLPKGETPDEAVTRVKAEALTPVSYSISLSGSADNGDADEVVKAFEKVVKLLRKTGVSVNGGLTGQAPAFRDAAGTLYPEQVIHTLAGDVED